MNTHKPTAAMASLGRLYWLLIGPMQLFVSAYIVLSDGGGLWTMANGSVLFALGGMALGRWLEFRGGNPQTSTGEPASREDLGRFVLTLVLVAVAWLFVNMLGAYL